MKLALGFLQVFPRNMYLLTLERALMRVEIHFSVVIKIWQEFFIRAKMRGTRY